jgi:hypothetical protein
VGSRKEAISIFEITARDEVIDGNSAAAHCRAPLACATHQDEPSAI